MLRKPLPWLPAWVAFVSLGLDPTESPPLSRKMRRRRRERTTGVGRKGEREQETGRQRLRERQGERCLHKEKQKSRNRL